LGYAYKSFSGTATVQPPAAATTTTTTLQQPIVVQQTQNLQKVMNDMSENDISHPQPQPPSWRT